MDNNSNNPHNNEIARTDGTPISNYPGQPANYPQPNQLPAGGTPNQPSLGAPNSNYGQPNAGQGNYIQPGYNAGQTTSYSNPGGVSQFGSPGSLPSYGNTSGASSYGTPANGASSYGTPANNASSYGTPTSGANMGAQQPPYYQPQPAPSNYGSGATPSQPGYGYAETHKQQAGYGMPPYPQAGQIQSAYKQQPPYGQGFGMGRRDPNIAFALELIGFVGFLGIGHMYAGNVILGVLMLLFGWGVVGFLYVLASILTLGIGFCLFLPVFALVPVISGILARNTAMRNNMMGR